MRYKYENKAEASKSIPVKNIPGLPNDIFLKFSNLHIRFYNSINFSGYFLCTLALPAFKDDDGYVLENEFKLKRFDDLDVDLSDYDVPLQGHSIKNLQTSIACNFEDKVEMGRRILVLNMTIKGTPFNGYVFFEENLYTITGQETTTKNFST
ncbi:hypothetical protein [Ferrovum sp.]|uniref:hypothetical protein n=1 Tax=Ferrovum sp. TaxID=2609467 RepID=UPI00262A06D9|nr:hypothetical protein [Ferrovum sp.]